MPASDTVLLQCPVMDQEPNFSDKASCWKQKAIVHSECGYGLNKAATAVSHPSSRIEHVSPIERTLKTTTFPLSKNLSFVFVLWTASPVFAALTFRTVSVSSLELRPSAELPNPEC
ncbi:hypothetical protein MHYP_G00209830 [Metynnis hypsauchen]